MKILFLLFFVACFGLQAQTDSTKINLDLLRGPVSPASNLLGISPNDIQRPTDIKGFMLSLQNASQNFSTLPSTFAVDVAPFWLSKQGKYLTSTRDVKNTFGKTLVFSVAVRNYQSKAKIDSTTQIGLGLRFSIYRENKFRQKIIKQIYESIQFKGSLLDSAQKYNKEYQRLESQKDSVNKLLAVTVDSTEKVALRKKHIEITSMESIITNNIITTDSLKFLSNVIKAENTKLIRIGWKIDFAGGISWNIPETKFDNAQIHKVGAWLTGGYEGENGHSLFAIARWLYNPDKIFADDKGVIKNKSVNTFDIGVKYNYQMYESPLNLSFEFVHRGVASTEIENTWRATFNASYEIDKNMILTLALGRDYDKTMKKDGNVIALLNLVKGFGWNGKN